MPSTNLPRLAGAASVTLCVAHLKTIALNAAHEVLSVDERQRAKGISHRESREQFVKTRALLRLLLGRATAVHPADLPLTDADGEAPRLAGNRQGLCFSVSHSYDWAAVAVAPFPVGVDIERVDADHDWGPVSDILFHPDERLCLEAAGPAARTPVFFETWTRKEAYLKGIGAGLRLDPASFSTQSSDGAVTGVASEGGWHTVPVDAPAGYAAALAVCGLGLAKLASAGRLLDRIELAELFRDTQPVGILCANEDIPSRRIVLS